MWMRSRPKAWMLALDLFVQRRKTNYRHHIFDLIDLLDHRLVDDKLNGGPR